MPKILQIIYIFFKFTITFYYIVCYNNTIKGGNNMKLSLTYSTRTYYINHNFYVDIISNFESEYYEAWIWNNRYSIKEHIMSAPMQQQTITEFMDIIENNIQEDIKFYVANHFDYADKEEFYANYNNQIKR